MKSPRSLSFLLTLPFPSAFPAIFTDSGPFSAPIVSAFIVRGEPLTVLASENGSPNFLLEAEFRAPPNSISLSTSSPPFRNVSLAPKSRSPPESSIVAVLQRRKGKKTDPTEEPPESSIGSRSTKLDSEEREDRVSQISQFERL
uniref:Uncharacterized protein n=1 Tax=Opuntia streptacantha TaxID=393608 RepID=A0A7C9EHS0_OPUST